MEPIELETQIIDSIFGVSKDMEKRIADKIAFTTKNAHLITEVNGKKVYNVITKGDNLYYNLVKRGGTEYYYPIQYAYIKF